MQKRNPKKTVNHCPVSSFFTFSEGLKVASLKGNSHGQETVNSLPKQGLQCIKYDLAPTTRKPAITKPLKTITKTLKIKKSLKITTITKNHYKTTRTPLEKETKTTPSLRLRGPLASYTWRSPNEGGPGHLEVKGLFPTLGKQKAKALLSFVGLLKVKPT